MLNPRRALIAAAFILAVFFLLSRSHTPTSSAPSASERHDAQAEAAAAAAAEAAASQQRAVPPPPPQKPMIDMSGMSTYEKLDYAYSYDIESKFPAYIWQTWKHTPGEGEFEFREQEASWSIEHPGFIHEVITDSVAATLLQLLYGSIPEVLETYHALPLPVLKADFFRYLILYARGGIYSDIDTYAIRSALEWIPQQIPKETVGLVIGIEADPDRADWADWYSRRIQFCQWTIQAKPGHPVLRDIISRITNSTLALKKAGKLSNFKGNDVVDLTGPAVWTDTIMDYFNDERFFDMEHSKGKIDYRNFTGMETSKRVGDVVVLPITSFSPGVGQMGAKDYDDPMAFVKHDFEGTWKPESERHIGEVQQELGDLQLVEDGQQI